MRSPKKGKGLRKIGIFNYFQVMTGVTVGGKAGVSKYWRISVMSVMDDLERMSKKLATKLMKLSDGNWTVGLMDN